MPGQSARVVLLVIGLVLLAAVFLYVTNLLAWQLLPRPGTYAMALADLDGDGDLDAFLANGGNEVPDPNTVLLNDGNGRFRNSGQQLGDFWSRAVTLHDYDDDGDVDALVSNVSWGEFFYNDGDGAFSDGEFVSMPPPNGFSGYHIGMWRFRTAELNGDGRTDLVLAGCCGGGVSDGPDSWQTLNPYNTVWLGDDGTLTASGQQFGSGSTADVGLADLDGDGDVDAFGANTFFLDPEGVPVTDANSVWFNDGQGNFVDSGQRLGQRRSHAVAMGDVDGDGDQDALVGNDGPDELWFNDGTGQFADSGQALGNSMSRFVVLVDFDADDDLDALLADDRQATIWLNDGHGSFRFSGQRLRYRGKHGIAVGDVDGNGAVDVVAGRRDGALVWRNDGAGNMRRR